METAVKRNANQLSVILNAQEIYDRWGGKIKMDAVRKLLATNQIKALMIGNCYCAHLRFVEEFEMKLFSLEKPMVLNENTYAAVSVAPASWINKEPKAANFSQFKGGNHA